MNAERIGASLADRYRIERELGQGGMATVYLAHDLKHDRKVAIKVLKPELAAVLGAERFVQEIKTTAALSHPHILPLFDSGETGGFLYYVMPYIQGETIRQKLNRETQFGIEEAVRLTTEVADALDYAHRHGVIHRDIKPENILLHDGRPMVMDFGIALAVSAAAGGRMTETGLSLGTPHYMSPEQATAEREITGRSDLYSLGCVLYEMLAGAPPHVGATAQQIIMKIVTEEAAPVTNLRRAVPPHVAAAVAQALEKLPADRFESARAFAETLAGRAPGSHRSAIPSMARLKHSSRFPVRGTLVVSWVIALAAIGLLAREWARPMSPPPPIARFALKATPVVESTIQGQAVALSPDGSQLVYVGIGPTGNQLYLRGMADLTPTAFAAITNPESPFFSPTGKEIAFQSGGQLQRIPVRGGPILPIANAGNLFRGGTWNERDTILFANERGLFVVPAAGGNPELVAAPDSGSGETFRWPEFLPGGRAALFGIHDGAVDRPAVLTLDTREIVRFDLVGANPRYVEPGWLILAIIDQPSGQVTNGSLVAVPFDLGRRRPTGAPMPVADSVQVGLNTRVAKMGVSRDGAMVYVSGALAMFRLVTAGRDGRRHDIGAPLRFYMTPRFSPDGGRVAVQVNDQGSDIWLFDLRARNLTRLTFERSAVRPLWTPDGRRVVFERSTPSTGQDLAWIPADGSSLAEPLVSAPGDQATGAVTPDGRALVIRELPVNSRRRISIVRLDPTGAPEPFVEGPFQAYAPSLSPDGHWLAYVSDESGRNEVYVRPFPGPGGRWQVSRDGGNEPRWSPTGSEIFFRMGTELMAASVQAGATFASGEVRALLAMRTPSGIAFTNYDVSRDGQTFLMAELTSDQAQLVVVLNWFRHQSPRTR